MKVYDHRYVASFFKAYPLDKSALSYIHFHKFRFAFILNQMEILRRKQDISTVLDIGPSYLTNLIGSTFQELTLETMGLNNNLVDRTRSLAHFQVDLNFISTAKNLPLAKYDLVIFAEVIEHLYTDPGIILQHIRRLIKPGGCLLLQTPNAVSIDKRIKMLIGKNPYQFIIANRQNHFREYTARELIKYLDHSGFEIIKCFYSNYFNPDASFFHRLFRVAGPVMPAPWRDGITLISRVKT